MTPKERVLTTLSHREPDRVPVGEFAIDHEAFDHVLGRESFWRGHFRMEKALWEGRRDEVVETMIADMIEFHREVPLDMVTVHHVPSKDYTPEPYEEIEPGIWKDKKDNIYRFSTGSHRMIMVERNEPEREWSLDDFPMPEGPPEQDESQWELIRAAVKEFGDTHFICARSGDGTFPQVGGTWEQAMMSYIDRPELVERAAQVDVEHTLLQQEIWKREGVDGLAPGSDYCDTRGPMISPDLIRKYLFPAMKRHVDGTRETVKLPILKHACGNNWRIMDMLVDAGYDAYQAIQGSATMDIVKLKEQYGDRLTLWGGVNTETLVAGNEDDVREEVRHVIEHVAPGGGFIMGSSHSILVGSKPENFLAMVDETVKTGWY